MAASADDHHEFRTGPTQHGNAGKGIVLRVIRERAAACESCVRASKGVGLLEAIVARSASCVYTANGAGGVTTGSSDVQPASWQHRQKSR